MCGGRKSAVSSNLPLASTPSGGIRRTSNDMCNNRAPITPHVVATPAALSLSWFTSGCGGNHCSWRGADQIREQKKKFHTKIKSKLRPPLRSLFVKLLTLRAFNERFRVIQHPKNRRLPLLSVRPISIYQNSERECVFQLCVKTENIFSVLANPCLNVCAQSKLHTFAFSDGAFGIRIKLVPVNSESFHIT